MIHGTRAARRDHGYTLIEMVLIVAAATLVMGLAASLLGALFKIERGSRAAVTDAQTATRLAEQFRADVHAGETAKAASPKPGGTGWEISGVDGLSIKYRLDGGRLIREASRREKVLGRETYEIGRLGPLRFGVEGERAWLILSRRVEEGAGVSRPPLRIEGVVGKDRRAARVVLESQPKPKGDQ